MKKIKINKVDEVIYYEKLDNGLDIYIYKKEGFEKKCCYIQTKYGSLNNEFIPINEDKYVKFPLGIAHFLEHKLFESNDNSNIFSLFEKNGAYVNAATSYDKTFYYFSSSSNFYDNLSLLINMVETPYFTDENVEKEKGIIGQEIDMYLNDPESFMYKKVYSNSIINSPLKYDIAGSFDDINQITKEDLYKCYNTFYNPSNMSLFIAGDIDPVKVIDFIKKIEEKRSINKINKIVNKEYSEPEYVLKKEEVVYHNVTKTKICYTYKNILPKVDKEKDFLRRFYIRIFLSTKFGDCSSFSENLIKEGLVNSYFYYDYTFIDNIALIFFSGDVIDDVKVQNRIEESLKDLNDLEEMFDLYKRNFISGYVNSFEGIDNVINSLRSMVNTYGTVFDNLYELYSNASFTDYLSVIKSLSLENKSKVIVKNKEDLNVRSKRSN